MSCGHMRQPGTSRCCRSRRQGSRRGAVQGLGLHDVEPMSTVLDIEDIDQLIQSWSVGKKGLLEACT